MTHVSVCFRFAQALFTVVWPPFVERNTKESAKDRANARRSMSTTYKRLSRLRTVTGSLSQSESPEVSRPVFLCTLVVGLGKQD